MKISIITFVLILTFCATGFSQSAFSLELRYQPTIRTHEWNKLEKSPFISEFLYPNKKGLLVNYRIGKKGRHYIKTGLMIDNFKYKMDDLEYHPGTMRPLHAEEVIYRNYGYNMPLYYSFLYKGIYTEIGAQFNRTFMNKFYYAFNESQLNFNYCTLSPFIKNSIKKGKIK